LLSKFSGKLKPEYDDNREGYKLFRFLKPLVLTCIADTPAESEKVIWSKMDDKKAWKSVKDIGDLNGRYVIIPKEGKFVIEKGREEDVGNYSCSLGDVSYTFNVYASVVVAVPKYVYAVEEEKIEVECIVKGTNPDITWEFRPDNSNESKKISDEQDRIKFSEYKNIDNAKLTIEKANLTDRGYYTCVGTNELMDDSARAEGFVRVKDKLAALWPFLGICAEVFVLCAIILIYEKRRNKTDLDESDTDQSPDQKNDSHMKDSDVRHRK